MVSYMIGFDQNRGMSLDWGASSPHKHTLLTVVPMASTCQGKMCDSHPGRAGRSPGLGRGSQTRRARASHLPFPLLPATFGGPGPLQVLSGPGECQGGPTGQGTLDVLMLAIMPHPSWARLARAPH